MLERKTLTGWGCHRSYTQGSNEPVMRQVNILRKLVVDRTTPGAVSVRAYILLTFRCMSLNTTLMSYAHVES